jgi:hypothetical protein
MVSVPELTRMIAHIEEWRDGHGKPGGRAEAARRLDAAHKLLAEIRSSQKPGIGFRPPMMRKIADSTKTYGPPRLQG